MNIDILNEFFEPFYKNTEKKEILQHFNSSKLLFVLCQAFWVQCTFVYHANREAIKGVKRNLVKIKEL